MRPNERQSPAYLGLAITAAAFLLMLWWMLN
jgi:hypothetical protein